jgi:hypothetical protein
MVGQSLSSDRLFLLSWARLAKAVHQQFPARNNTGNTWVWTVNVSPTANMYWLMKMTNLIRLRNRQQLVRQFGQAKLIQLANGQHELIGGSEADQADALQWASLFAHEIVFMHCQRETAVPCRSRKSRFASRFSPA